MDTDDLIEHLIESNISTYRLSDGSFIMAEEVDIEGDDRLLISFPSEIASLSQDSDEIVLQPWDLFVTSSLIELNPNSIISKTEASLPLKAHYFNFVAGCTAATADEIERDIEEAYEILEYLKPLNHVDKLKESVHSNRWNWNPELN